MGVPVLILCRIISGFVAGSTLRGMREGEEREGLGLVRDVGVSAT